MYKRNKDPLWLRLVEALPQVFSFIVGGTIFFAIPYFIYRFWKMVLFGG